jgi:surfactin synthase thioesterase subunit
MIASLLALRGNGGDAFRFERARAHVPKDVRFRALTLPGFGDRLRDPSLRTLRDYADHLRNLLIREPPPIGFLIYMLSRPPGALAICESCRKKRLATLPSCPHCGME